MKRWRQECGYGYRLPVACCGLVTGNRTENRIWIIKTIRKSILAAELACKEILEVCHSSDFQAESKMTNRP